MSNTPRLLNWIVLSVATCLIANADRTPVSAADRPAQPPDHRAAWQSGNVHELGGIRVTLSQPVLVARSRGFLWFPTLIRLSNGDLLAEMSNYADVHTATSTSSVSWSRDWGRTWTALVDGQYGETSVTLPGGDELLLPY